MNRVLVSAQGQADNVGDSVLRRGLLDAVRAAGPLTVNVTDCPDGYVRGLRLDPADTVVRDRREWQRAVAAGAWQGAGFAYNAGEELLAAGWAASYLRLAPLLTLARLRGGGAVHTGFGLRADHRVWARAFRVGLAPCRVVTWRDQASRDWVGRGRVEPDWAYAAGPAAPDGVGALPGPGRDVLAVTLRGDRPPPGPAWTKAVQAVAADRDLQVVVVAQVGRDSARARDLASLLGAELVDWAGPAHDVAEEAVRAVYRRAELVVSDRLHAVVMGHTEGAVPVGLAPGSTGGVAKIDRTLAAVGVRGAAFGADDDAAAATARVHDLLERRTQVLACADEAATRLRRLTQEMSAALAGRRT